MVGVNLLQNEQGYQERRVGGGRGVAPSEKTGGGGSNPGGNIDIFIYFDILMYHVYISCK